MRTCDNCNRTFPSEDVDCTFIPGTGDSAICRKCRNAAENDYRYGVESEDDPDEVRKRLLAERALLAPGEP